MSCVLRKSLLPFEPSSHIKHLLLERKWSPTCLLGPKQNRHLVLAWKFLSYQSWEGAYVSISSDFEVVSLWSHLDWSLNYQMQVLNYQMQVFFNFHWFSSECEVISGGWSKRISCKWDKQLFANSWRQVLMMFSCIKMCPGTQGLALLSWINDWLLCQRKQLYQFN